MTNPVLFLHSNEIKKFSLIGITYPSPAEKPIRILFQEFQNSMIEDEGFFRTLKIAFNILTHPKERKHIFEMQKVFRKYQSYLNAISIVAEKR